MKDKCLNKVRHLVKKTYLKITSLVLPIDDYKPAYKIGPKNTIDVPFSWKGLELIIEDILNRFKIERKDWIEFGVENGYSSAVFANYFENVIWIDTFEGDIHSSRRSDFFQNTQNNLSPFPNIRLEQINYIDWINKDNRKYNFCHVDIVYNYKKTIECGLWDAQHSDCVIFHDTESFPQVRKAVIDISRLTGKQLYNHPNYYGLGILVDINHFDWKIMCENKIRI